MAEIGNGLYTELVHNAYIDPIKSILAVDDEYASLDTFLKYQQDQSPDLTRVDIERQIATLNLARQKNWLVDMLDCPSPDDERGVLSRLHQSDLLLIDYHLDNTQPTDPTLALKLLRALNSNHHFNLIIVYTREEDLPKVQREIFKTLAPPIVFKGVSTEIVQKVEKWLEDGFDIFDTLVDNVTDSDILNFYRTENLDDLKIVLEPIWEEENEKPDALTLPELESLYIHVLNEKIRRQSENSEYQGTSTIKVSGTEGPIWLKTDLAFIAIASKNTTDPDMLLNILTDALCDWGPTSHRLLLAKIESEIDDNGQAFENQVLGCEYTNAGWLKELLGSSDGSYKTLTRLMEGLTHALGQNANINEFASKIKSYVEEIGINEAIRQETSSRVELPRDDKQILINLNAHICSISPSGSHLHPGHVIEWVDGETKEYWICLTPFCDLVPGQKTGNWAASLGSYIPVKFVKLHSHDDYFNHKKTEEKKLKELRKEITRKSHLFISVDGKVSGFSVSKEKNTPIHWEQWFASDNGRISQFERTLFVTMTRNCFEEYSGEFSCYSKRCRVVGHLRYEYALNLISMLGESLTRIGLDFTQ